MTDSKIFQIQIFLNIFVPIDWTFKLIICSIHYGGHLEFQIDTKLIVFRGTVKPSFVHDRISLHYKNIFLRKGLFVNVLQVLLREAWHPFLSKLFGICCSSTFASSDC